ncbi:MAG: GDSL-type esterase/lipase family protein [Lacunisphaera sp.]
MKKHLSFLIGCFSLAAAVYAQTPAAPAPASPAVAAAPVDASSATPKTGNARFFELHEQFLARGKAGPIGVLFLGDSITEGWTKAPHIWDHYYARWQPANFGIGGDQTQHVIWRIENGELDGISPKVVVLMIGTNNTGSYTAEQIAAADRKIVGLIQTHLPATKILVLAVFPRGPRKMRDGQLEAWEKRMEIIHAVNADLAKLDNGTTVRFLDLNARFFGNDGTIPNIIMPDQLHPNAAGYQLWAEAMQPLLTEMMK